MDNSSFLPFPFKLTLSLVFFVFWSWFRNLGAMFDCSLSPLLNTKSQCLWPQTSHQCPSSGSHVLTISHLRYCSNFLTDTLTPVISTFDQLSQSFFSKVHMVTHPCSDCSVAPFHLQSKTQTWYHSILGSSWRASCPWPAPYHRVTGFPITYFAVGHTCALHMLIFSFWNVLFPLCCPPEKFLLIL